MTSGQASGAATGIRRDETGRRAVRRRALKLGGLLAALVLPAASGCGIQPTGITSLGPAPAVSGGAAQRALAQQVGSSQYVLFFYQDGRLTPTYRNSDSTTNEETVLGAMLQGPTKEEAAQGMSTALPTGLIAVPRASGQADAYMVTEPLTTKAKAQFLCTMQYWDQSISVGIQIKGAEKPTWNACADMVDYYVPMPGDGSAVGAMPSG